MAKTIYRANRTGWVRGGMGCLLAGPVLGLVGTGVFLLTLGSALGMFSALVCLVVVLFCLVIFIINTRVQFTVDDEGISIVWSVDTIRIRWEEIAVIEQSGGYRTAGAVVIVLRYPPGKRIIARPTTDRMAIYRGETPFFTTDPAAVPRTPTRAAIDGHRRWLARQAR